MKSNRLYNLLAALLLWCCLTTNVNAQQTSTFSVATLNVDGLPGKIAFLNINAEGPQVAGSLRISNYLAKKDCDILCLQENFNYRWEIWSQLLLKYKKDEWSGGISLIGQDIDYAHLQNTKFKCDGLNTLWHHGICNHGYERTPWTHNFGKFSHDFDDIITKGFRRHELKLADGGEVVVYNLHMDASSDRDEQKLNDGRDREARLAQWQQLADDILAHLDNRPVIVAGDMNSYYHRDDFQTVFIQAIEATGRATVGDAWVETNLGGSYPALGSEPLADETLDKILYINPTGGNSITPVSVTLDREGYMDGDKPLGDHFPLIATFQLDSSADSGSPVAEVNYTVTKISNPDRGEREVDGLTADGDRENSYTWRLAGRGDEIYIATSRNVASALVNMYGSQISAAAGMSMDTFWSMVDVVFNGDIYRNDVSEGANIISYNRKTGEFKTIWTAEPGVYQRMAVTFGDDVYFGSYSANQGIEQYILKLDKDGNFTKVYTTTGTTAMRANCVYDGHLFFASSDARTVVAEGDPEPITKMAVIRKSNDDDTQWDLVADYHDFGDIPYDPIQTNWAGAPFWELASHAGYIYATAPSTAGFVIFKGHPAQGGESANEYGWHWEEVAGLNNGLNNPGLSDVEGGEPGTMRSLIGSVYEFNGELYAYNFDHAFAGVAQTFVGMLQQTTGADVKASDYLGYIYDTLHNPQKVWKLNDATGKFDELTAFTQLMEGTTNEYIWRMGEHNGKLYVATMDAGIGYGYMTQLTNGSFFKMSNGERLSKIQYIGNVIKLLALAKGNETMDELRGKLELLKALFEQFVETDQADDGSVELIVDIQGLTQEIKTIVTAMLTAQTGERLVQLNDVLVNMLTNLQSLNEQEAGAISAMLMILEYVGLTNLWHQLLSDLATLTPETAKEKVQETVETILAAIVGKMQDTMDNIHERVDVKGIEMYAYINHAVRTNEWGFDLLRTDDGGQNFEVITRTGFDDKYNYGCPSFLSTEEGLYFGTCNPFYGGQLFLLSEEGDEPIDIVTGITNVETVKKQGNIFYTLNGQRVANPNRPGIYLQNGKKTVVSK